MVADSILEEENIYKSYIVCVCLLLFLLFFCLWKDQMLVNSSSSCKSFNAL